MAWTEEEVLINKNNMLIAEFMGAEILSKESKFSYVQYPMDAWVADIGAHEETYKQKLHSKALKYHESYNWIMAVVDKIETIEVQSYIDFHIMPDAVIVRDQINEDEPLIIINKSECKGSIENEFTMFETKIQAIYDAVLIFIKWYNDKRTKDS